MFLTVACTTSYNTSHTFIEAVKHLTSFNVVKCLTASKSVLNDLYNKVRAMLLSLRIYLCNVFGWPHVRVCLNFVQSVLFYEHINEIALSYLLSEFQGCK